MALGGLFGGCSSLISSSALALMATSLIGSAVVFFKKIKRWTDVFHIRPFHFTNKL